MNFGIASINLGVVAQPSLLVEIAQRAEATGFESLWTVEHLVLADPQRRPSPLPPDAWLLEPLITLSYVAARTSRLRLGTGVLILPFRNPVVLAKQIASLDVLSAGRVLLGVGVGYVESEFAALGVPFAERGRRADDYIAAMRALWTQPHPAYHGAYADVQDVCSRPSPVQAQVPVIVGGSSSAAYRRAVRLGHGWYGYGLSLDEARRRIAALKHAADVVDRLPHLGQLGITITPDEPPSEATVVALVGLGVDRINLLLPNSTDPGVLDQFFASATQLIRQTA